jgi:hypothetical protein
MKVRTLTRILTDEMIESETVVMVSEEMGKDWIKRGIAEEVKIESIAKKSKK